MIHAGAYDHSLLQPEHKVGITAISDGNVITSVGLAKTFSNVVYSTDTGLMDITTTEDHGFHEGKFITLAGIGMTCYLSYTYGVSGSITGGTGYGNNLSNPDTLLIVAAYSSNFVFGPVTASAFVRNDQNDSWNETIIFEGDLPAGDSYSIRDMEIYTDQVTGEEMLFTSVGTNGIFVGKYDPDSQNKIQWSSFPEYGPIDIRSLGIVTANNALYFSSGNKIYKLSLIHI